MNYAQARQREGGRWDWTVMNDKRVRPAGYCAGWPYDVMLRDGVPGLPAGSIEREAKEREPFRAKYHEDGHATQEEAERCHRDYLLDHRLREVGDASTQKRCAVCATWTSRGLSLDDSEVSYLCNEHRTREHFEELHPFAAGVQEMYS